MIAVTVALRRQARPIPDCGHFPLPRKQQMLAGIKAKRKCRKEAIEMKPVKAMGMDVQSGVRTDDGLPLQVGLDAQLAELFEAIWSCERQWTIDDRIDAAIKYGRL